jgi:hypothetical protein
MVLITPLVTIASEGCKKPSKDAISKAEGKAQGLGDGKLGIFDFDGTLKRTARVAGNDPRDAASKLCKDLQPISDKCWVCCTTGEIICKNSKSDEVNHRQ